MSVKATERLEALLATRIAAAGAHCHHKPSPNKPEPPGH